MIVRPPVMDKEQVIHPTYGPGPHPFLSEAVVALSVIRRLAMPRG
jgi:hypothetical protein